MGTIHINTTGGIKWVENLGQIQTIVEGINIDLWVEVVETIF